MSFSTPILLIVFNRPATTAQVFSVIKKLQPKNLFISLDAPRGTEDLDACDAVDKTVKNIDWDCNVHYLNSEHNLGLKVAVPRAINWFFDQVEEGIILEDDCLPDLSFFTYCAELLSRYRYDERIWHISGNYFQTKTNGKYDYYFSHIAHIWGWATWKRAWLNYDIKMPDFPDFVANNYLNEFFSSRLARQFWLYVFNKNYLNLDNTWDFQWSYALMRHQALAINPTVNLISNLGFGADATHSIQSNSPHANLATQAINLPLRHPTLIIADRQADDFIMRHNFAVTWHNFFLKHLLRKLGLFELVKKLYYRLKQYSK